MERIRPNGSNGQVVVSVRNRYRTRHGIGNDADVERAIAIRRERELRVRDDGKHDNEKQQRSFQCRGEIHLSRSLKIAAPEFNSFRLKQTSVLVRRMTATHL